MLPKISSKEYQQRREKFLAQLPEDSIAVIPTDPVRFKTADTDYPFHPNNNLYYLTGYSEQNCVAVFIPGRKEGSFILFNLAKIHEEEIWNGMRVGQEAAITDFGADQAFVVTEFEKKIYELMQGKKKLLFTLGRNPEYDQLMLRVLNQLKSGVRSGIAWPNEIINVESIIHEMRLIKSPEEIELMRYAAQASVVAHKRAMKACKPGLNEYHIDAELTYAFMSQGCQGPAYGSIVASGGNGIVLHYSSNNAPLTAGDLLLVDAGAEYDFYDADITTTYPINGKFSQEQKIIYDLVLESQMAGLSKVKAGTPWPEIQTAITTVLTKGLVELGILQGDINQLLAERAFAKFYMHNSGHWLGLDTHDVGAYKLNNTWRKLEAGMVLTVEPGLYLSKNCPGLATKWHDIAVRIEDDILVTADGYEKLSSGLPRTTEEIEAFMND